jgi:hypothetical protein
MKKRNQKIVIAIFIIGIIIFLMNILIDNPYTHRLVRVAINESVKTHTNLTIDFKAVKVSVVPPGVALYGVHVAPSAHLDNPILTASHAKARLSLWALFLGELRLAKLEFGDMTLIWPPPWDFPGFLKTDPNVKVVEKPTEVTWPPQFDLPIDTIAVKSSKIYIEIPTVEQVPLKKEVFAFSAVGIDAEFNYTTWQDSSLDLEIAAINASLGAVSMIEDTALETSIELAGKKINANFLKTKGERLNFDGKLFADLNLRGKNGILDSIKLTGGGKAASDFSLLGSYLDLKETFGAVTGEIVVNSEIPIESTKEAMFSLTGSGAVQNGYIDGFRLHNSFGKFEVTPEKLTLSDINIVIGDKTYGKGAGYIMFNDPLDMRFTASPDGLRLVDLLDALTVDFGVIDSAIHAQDLVLEGQGFPFFLKVKASAQFSDITLPETPYDQTRFPVSPACRFDFKMYVNADLLDFAGTTGECFQMESTTKYPAPGAGVTSAPQNALAVSPVSLDGKIHFQESKGLDLIAKSPSINLKLSEYFAQVPMAGIGQLESRIYGPFSKVLIKNNATIDNTFVNNMPFGRVKGEATVDTLLVYWKDIEVNLPAGGLVTATKGSLDIEKNLFFDTDFSLQEVSEESTKNIINPYLDGKPESSIEFGIDSATGRLSGPIMHPFAWNVDANLGLRNMKFGQEKFFDSFTAVLSAEKNSIQISNALYLLGDFASRLSTKVTRQKPFSPEEAEASDDLLTFLGINPADIFLINVASVSTADKVNTQESAVAADHLGLIPFAGTYLKKAEITGQIELKGKVEGPLNNLQGVINGRIRKPSIFGSILSPVEFRSFVAGSHFDVMVEHSGASLKGRLSFDIMEPNIPYEWFLTLNRMDLRPFGTNFFHSDPRNYAYLTADWNMKGHFTDWWRSTGTLNLNDVRAQFAQDIGAQTRTMQIRQEQPVSVEISDKGWKFKDDRDLYLTGKHLQLRLSLPDNNPPEKLGVRLESIVDMGILREFSQAVDTATGKVRVVMQIAGPVEDPEFSVEVTDLKPNPFIAATWSPVTIGLADIRPAFRNIRFRAVYEKGRIIIDSLQADKGSGKVSANGAMVLSEDIAETSRLDINLSDATVIYPVAFLKSFETQLSGLVTISGKGLPYKVSGDIVVNRARSTKEVDIRDEIINALRQKSITSGYVNEKPIVTLDLNVTADKSINIHNRNLQSVLSADIQVRGDDINPIVGGQVEFDRGKFIYKREFQVQRGIVLFDDPVKPDPTLDILAVSEVDNYRVYIAATGKASNPTIEFSIDPPTRETGTAISKLEILVLLSRGKLSEENKSIGQETQSAAASEAANLILGQFEEPVERLFDLSGQSVVRNVYIDTHPDTEGRPVPRFNLPLDLGDEFDIVLKTDGATSEASTEYNLHENIKFSGVLERRVVEDSTNQSKSPVDNDAKVNLKFRFSFE